MFAFQNDTLLYYKMDFLFVIILPFCSRFVNKNQPIVENT